MGLFRNREKIEQEDIIKAEQAYIYDIEENGHGD